MTWRQWRYGQRRLGQAGVPDPPPPYSVEAWCAAIAAHRGRPVNIETVSGVPPAGPAGLLVSMTDADYIIIDRNTPAILARHIVLHELAHLLLDHDGAASADTATADSAVPDPGTVRHLLGRSVHLVNDAREHHEAEAAADVMAAQLARCGRPSTFPRPDTNPVDAVSRWLRRRWLYWHLHQLWLALCSTFPHICLDPPAYPELDDQLPMRGSYQALYRRVIEIHDGLYRLHQRTDGLVRDRACQRARRANLQDWRIDAVAQAAAIALALRTRASAYPVGAVEGEDRCEGGLDLDAEALRLVRIARALTDSPLVEAEVALGRRASWWTDCQPLTCEP